MSTEPIGYATSRSQTKAQFVSRLNHYRDLLARKWWVLAAGLLVGGAVEAAIWFLQPPSFVSIGRMIVSLKLTIPEGSVYAEEMNSFLGTQAALMQSSAVGNRAFMRVLTQHPELTNRPVALKVSVSPKTSIFVLQATGSDSRYVQAFLQACMESYIQLKKEMRAQTSDTTVAGLTEELLRLQKDLRASEEALVQFQGSNSIVLLQEQGNGAGNYLAALNQRLASLRSEHTLLQTLTLDQNLERRHEASTGLSVASLPPNPTTANATPPDRSDTDYLRAKQQLQLLKADQEEMAQYLRPKHPRMIAMGDEIARRERLLEIFRQQSADQLDNRKSSLAIQIKNLETEIKDWDAKTLDLSRKTAEFQRLKANTQRMQAIYDRLLATMQTLDVNKEISPESVTIMEPASPAFVDHLKHMRQLLFAGLAALALTIGLLVLLDRLDDRVSSFTELQELFEEPVLVQIPREKTGSRTRPLDLIEPNDRRYALVEAYRNLRSSLFYLAEGQPRPKTLLLTSSVPNDGKSMTSANLAITLANAGSRVLLVDADLRKGVLHQRFQITARPGFHEVLAEGQDWESVVHPTRVVNLDLLPRGETTLRSSELFISDATRRFLKSSAAGYDFVILDTAPVMAADDVTSLAPHVDGVIFVLRAEQTSARVAHAALDLLYQRNVRVLGLVFNAVRPTSADYRYYHNYKDYYVSYPAAETNAP